VFFCPYLTLCTGGNPLTSLTGRSQSQAIGEVVAQVALLSVLELSSESPVWYCRHCRKIVISLWSPFLVLLGLGLPLLLLLLWSRRLAPYCLLSLAGNLVPLLPGLCSLMMVLSWDPAWLHAAGDILLFLGVSCCRLCPLRDMHLPRSGFRWATVSTLPNHTPPMCWFGFRSPSGVRLPLRPDFMPWVLLPLLCAVEAMTLSCLLLCPSPESSEWSLLLG